MADSFEGALEFKRIMQWARQMDADDIGDFQRDVEAIREYGKREALACAEVEGMLEFLRDYTRGGCDCKNCYVCDGVELLAAFEKLKGGG